MEPTLDQWIHRQLRPKYRLQQLVDRQPLTGGKSVRKTLCLWLSTEHHDFAILESSQTQWIVRAHDELHPGTPCGDCSRRASATAGGVRA